MKKIFLTLLLTAAMALSACGNAANSAAPVSGNTTSGNTANGESAGNNTEGINVRTDPNTETDANTNAEPDASVSANIETAASAPQTDGSLKFAVVGEYNGYIKEAIESYKTINPSATIEVSEYPWDIDQYTQSINTAIMSGGGEDLIDVSWLTWQKLADKDKLVDLNEYISFTDDEYFLSILDAYLYKGKRYTFPAAFQFNAFGYTEPYLGTEPVENLTIERLLYLAEKYPDKKLFYSYETSTPAMLATEILIHLDYNKYIDIENKTADVNNERFITFLNNVSRLGEAIATKPEEDIMLRDYQIWTPDNCSWTIEYAIENGMITSSSYGGSFDFSDFFLLTNDEGQGYFSLVGGLTPMPAINVNSPYRELAADFIKHMLSPQMQVSPELMFSPVNREAAATLGEEFKSSGREGEPGFDYDTNAKKFDQMVSQLKFAKNNDPNINSFIMSELISFFEGRQSAEQAASNLQSKLTLYLNE